MIVAQLYPRRFSRTCTRNFNWQHERSGRADCYLIDLPPPFLFYPLSLSRWQLFGIVLSQHEFRFDGVFLEFNPRFTGTHAFEENQLEPWEFGGMAEVCWYVIRRRPGSFGFDIRLLTILSLIIQPEKRKRVENNIPFRSYASI